MMTKEQLMEKYKDEKVLCVSNHDLKNLKNPKKNPIRTLMKGIKKHGYFDYRYNAEIDYSAKQVIPYVVLKCGDEYFATKRLNGDRRLVGGMSIAVGGHVNPCDLVDESSLDYPKNVVDACMVRELFEETTINFTNVCGKEYVTTFVDNSADVSKVHVCLLVVIELKNKDIEIRETNKLEGVWLNEQQVLDLYDKFENWSKIAIDLLKIGMHE